jgi:DNA sulfur modification protein DndD
MIFHRLKMHNFGVYAGVQEFDFSPNEDDQSLIIVGALNGGGKTTLLTAIQLVLYGTMSPSARSKGQSYDDFLRGKINRGTDPGEGASVSLDFSVSDDEGELLYSVRRYWKVNERNKIKERLEVYIDGKPNDFLTENWSEHIETLLPARIMPLFFFDGEKIEELADVAHTSEILSSAVSSLLGLDLVDQLTSDLAVFDFKKKKMLATDNEVTEIESAQKVLDHLEKDIEKLKLDREKKDAELVHRQYQHQDLVMEYSSQGGDLFEKVEDLKLQRSAAKSAWAEHADEMARLSEAAAPLLLVADLLDEVTIQSDLEKVSEKAEAIVELLSVHDKQTLQKLEDLGVENTKVEDVSNYLAEERAGHEEIARQEAYLDLSKDGREQLHRLNKQSLSKTSSEVIEDIQLTEEHSNNIDQLEKLLLAVPESEAIAPYRHAVDDNEKLIVSLEEDMRFLDRQINDVELKVSSVGKELRILMSKGVDARLENEDASRFLKHSEKVNKTLETFKQQLLGKKLRNLETLILDSFNELTRKENLISSLTIDPGTFEMNLLGEDGATLQPSDLSAGERQLLATSILWGLSKASQRRIPAIIDTPLGRMDSTHRETLCGRYFPKASHQVILLSTDEEVDERYFDILKPSINKTYRVEFDADKGGSAVSEGYLF